MIREGATSIAVFFGFLVVFVVFSLVVVRVAAAVGKRARSTPNGPNPQGTFTLLDDAGIDETPIRYHVGAMPIFDAGVEIAYSTRKALPNDPRFEEIARLMALTPHLDKDLFIAPAHAKALDQWAAIRSLAVFEAKTEHTTMETDAD